MAKYFWPLGGMLGTQIAGAATLATVPVLAPEIAAVLVGVGYGPNTPSSSQVLSQVVPERRRAFAFSIKQSGAPIGGVLAGLLLPFLVVVS